MLWWSDLMQFKHRYANSPIQHWNLTIKLRAECKYILKLKTEYSNSILYKLAFIHRNQPRWIVVIPWVRLFLWIYKGYRSIADVLCHIWLVFSFNLLATQAAIDIRHWFRKKPPAYLDFYRKKELNISNFLILLNHTCK